MFLLIKIINDSNIETDINGYSMYLFLCSLGEIKNSFLSYK